MLQARIPPVVHTEEGEKEREDREGTFPSLKSAEERGQRSTRQGWVGCPGLKGLWECGAIQRARNARTNERERPLTAQITRKERRGAAAGAARESHVTYLFDTVRREREREREGRGMSHGR